MTQREPKSDPAAAPILIPQSEELFRLLVASVSDYAIFMLDPTGRVATWNAGAERFKGYTEAEIIGRHFSAFYPETDIRAGKCEHELEVAGRTGRFEDEGWRVRKDGSQFWANVVITAVRDARGTLIGFAKITRDLTDRKRAEQESAARLAAEEASRIKDEFLAMLGHELRNPLAPIFTALQLVKLRGDKRSAREHAVIERQVKQMNRLVDDLLDVSRISRGRIELKQQPLDLREPLAQAVEISSPLFENKAQHFEVQLPPHGLVVHGDAARLVQVFTNLLNNAAKYTEPGGHIFLLVRHAGPHIVVEVRDDGMGIAPELLPRVFDLFVQGQQASDRSRGGLGLGLTLVKTLVQLHGGEVEARTNGARLGSSFLVRLPALAGPAPRELDDDAAEAIPTAEAARRRILLVEDNEDARVLLADMLAAMGHDVEAAADAPAALAALARFTPEVAILDLGLPGIDGYELAIQLRRQLSGIRLIALSGYGQAADQVRSRAAGFDLHFVKPVDLQRLLQSIALLLG